MASLDYHSLEENVGYIRSIIQDNYVIILKSMSVEVIDGIPLEKLYSLLFTLSKIEDYENKPELKSIIDDGNSPEEIIAEFVKIFRLEDPINIIEYIQSASNDLIERIDDLCQKAMRSSMEGQYRDTSVVKSNARSFFNKYPGTFIRDLIASGYSITENRDIYIKALEEHFSKFDPTIEEYAKEIFGIVVVTSTTELLSEAQQLSETFVTSADEMMKVNGLLEKIYKELFPYEEKWIV